jgi:hypothetical protein
MYKAIRDKRISTGEADGPDVARIVGQSRDDQEAFAADADSFFVLNGNSCRLSGVPDEDPVRESVRRGAFIHLTHPDFPGEWSSG